MCGIAGLITPLENRELFLDSMAETLIHRGPDDQGTYLKGALGLAHRRLSIIDPISGHQPMANEDDSLWIVYNGAIYNYLELRQELINKGHKFKTHSDTEVILHLYEEMGPDCLSRLNGMFAFALYDDNRQVVFCARDRMGIKPFYYAAFSDGIAFGSEIKALLALPFIIREPDYEALAEYLTFQFCLNHKTLFKNILKLPPANAMIISLSKSPPYPYKVFPYWTMEYQIDFDHDEDYFAERLLLTLEDAIRLRLRSDVPLGGQLSGGIDSSTVTCLACGLLSGKYHTFTGAFRDGYAYDETRYARTVSKHAGTCHNEIFLGPSDFIDTLPKLIYHMDEPAAGPGLFPQYFVSKLAAERVKVVLGGHGGDEIFGGYARYLICYLEQCLKGAIYETHEKAKFVVNLQSIIPNLPLLKDYKPLIQYLWSDGLFDAMNKRYFRVINRLHGTEDLLTPEFRSALDEKALLDSFDAIFNSSDTTSYFNKMTNFDQKTLLPALLHVEDRVSMAVSVESRVPFLDHRIVELAACMPPMIKFKAGQSKYVLRRAARNILPSQILARKDKMGFPVPLTEWLKDSIKGFVCDILLSDRTRNRGIYRASSLEEKILKKSLFDRALWGVLCLELWFRIFIESPPKQPLKEIRA